MSFPLSIGVIIAVAVVVCVGLHIFRWIWTRCAKRRTTIQFFSRRELWKSCGKTSGIVSILISSFLACTSALAITGLVGLVEKNQDLLNNSINISKMVSGTLSDLKQTSEQLALQGRTSISSFPDFRRKAENMLKRVHMDRESQVKIVVFWPMFGADSGPSVQESAELITTFYDEGENLFYYYLFKRFEHNLPVELIFLKFRLNTEERSPFFDFVDMLSEYLIPRPHETKRRNFSEERAKKLKEEAVEHIEGELLKQTENHPHNQVRVADNIPVLLFITAYKTEERIEKEALVFIGNVDMIRNQSRQGGFYTKDLEMIEVLEGLFASLWKRSDPLEKWVERIKG